MRNRELLRAYRFRPVVETTHSQLGIRAESVCRWVKSAQFSGPAVPILAHGMRFAVGLDSKQHSNQSPCLAESATVSDSFVGNYCSDFVTWFGHFWIPGFHLFEDMKLGTDAVGCLFLVGECTLGWESRANYVVPPALGNKGTRTSPSKNQFHWLPWITFHRIHLETSPIRIASPPAFQPEKTRGKRTLRESIIKGWRQTVPPATDEFPEDGSPEDCKGAAQVKCERHGCCSDLLPELGQAKYIGHVSSYSCCPSPTTGDWCFMSFDALQKHSLIVV